MRNFPREFSITHNRVKISKVHRSQSIIIADMIYLSNHITCYTWFRDYLINAILPIKVTVNLYTKEF